MPRNAARNLPIVHNGTFQRAVNRINLPIAPCRFFAKRERYRSAYRLAAARSLRSSSAVRRGP